MNIRSVVVCSTTMPSMKSSLRYFVVYVQDQPEEDIRCFFDPAVSFLEDSLRQGNVLISTGGGSRGSAIAIAFLMKTQQMGLSEAYEQVTGCGYGGPNPGFGRQLREYASALGVPDSDSTAFVTPDLASPGESLDVLADDSEYESPEEECSTLFYIE
jgi:protein-tyrosine phosphatase